MKTIICGSRSFADTMTDRELYDLVCGVMEYARKVQSIIPTEVVSGHARGIDKTGEKWARLDGGCRVKWFPVTKQEWQDDPYGAGYTRNRQMGDYVASDSVRGACVCIHDGIKKHSGSTQMRDYALQLGLKVIYWNVLQPPNEPLGFL
jgi:hypothetical protein